MTDGFLHTWRGPTNLHPCLLTTGRPHSPTIYGVWQGWPPYRGKVLNWPLHVRGASRQHGKVQGCKLVKPVFAALPAWMPRMNWGTRSTVALSEGLLCLGWALVWPSSADQPSRKNAREPQSSQPLQNEVVMPLLGLVSESRNFKATIISSRLLRG